MKCNMQTGKMWFLLFIPLMFSACGGKNNNEIASRASSLSIEDISPHKSYKIKSFDFEIACLSSSSKGVFTYKMDSFGALSSKDVAAVNNLGSGSVYVNHYKAAFPLEFSINKGTATIELLDSAALDISFNSASGYSSFSYSKYDTTAYQLMLMFDAHFKENEEGKSFFKIIPTRYHTKDKPLFGWIYRDGSELKFIIFGQFGCDETITATYI